MSPARLADRSKRQSAVIATCIAATTDISPASARTNSTLPSGIDRTSTSATGPDDQHILTAGGEVHRRRNTVADIHLPNCERRKLRSDDTDRRVKQETDLGKPVGLDCSERPRVKRRGLGRVVGLGPGSLDACNIRQVRQGRSGLEFSDEVREASSVVQKDRRLRRFRYDVGAGHHLEEVCSNDAPDRGESILQRFRQTYHDIVSVDGKSLWARLSVGTDKAGRQS